ncbi:hypothetical protein J3Q64DRAFT_1476318 [Phycomyces blakesleeanus]|uniref:PH domain-containing protein n=2 Tax=Phycomyces blakesleeanus TaxID=4837 RepID=A0A162WSZ2_PHYB8|nr:hypothetical protein PHYBLDRAFT_187831 [Phycomyces blakesleeanus NRRL 1555(-)]OAD70765.1 hypothetical protein PHYBLDRAFT_187831 [Phycomyces blakesleeanus NRRL 1555(-)]|eukprot:XP_018288805.1 hypothetical protein PHYBLDRAFT_187831 [Phycomyces blakesleeanus NRRL 1555(-)]
MATPPKTEPISILKSSSNPRSGPSEYANRTARIVLSDDEDEDHHDNPNRFLSDGEEDDPPALPVSDDAVELLKNEKVVLSGYLRKKGEKRRTWKKRWFVLRTTKLAMYKDDKEYKLLRIIDLHEIHSVVQVTSKNKYKYVFAIITPRRMYYVQAKDQHDMDVWFEQIERAKQELKLYDTDDDASLKDRDQDYAKDVISSYQSNHAANMLHQRRSSTTTNEHISETPQTTRSHVPPVDIPRVSTSAHGAYSTSHTYPLSPGSDQQAQMQIVEGLASSEDDEEYGYNEDIMNAQLEETRNKVLIEGYLMKLGRNKSWRKRWFVLRTDTLAYYEDEKEYSPHRIIPLTHIIDSLEIEPISKSKQYCFKIIIPKRSYVLCASTVVDLESWLDALSVAVRRAKKEESETKSSPHTHSHPHPHPRPTSHTPDTAGYSLEKSTTLSSNESFDNSSHISGAGGVGGAGGALGGSSPSGLTKIHSRHSELLERAK